MYASHQIQCFAVSVILIQFIIEYLNFFILSVPLLFHWQCGTYLYPIIIFLFFLPFLAVLLEEALDALPEVNARPDATHLGFFAFLVVQQQEV